jgi:hypothetical protein
MRLGAFWSARSYVQLHERRAVPRRSPAQSGNETGGTDDDWKDSPLRACPRGHRAPRYCSSGLGRRPVAAHEGDAAHDGDDVRTGLTNPRHVRFGPDGNLYVAEAGVGGPEPAEATEGCELVDNRFSQDGPYKPGFTGRISRILPDGTRQTVATGLPSVVDNFGESLGPSDLAWLGGTMYVTLEGGGCSRGLPDHPAGIARVNADGTWEIVADVSAFVRANPVESEPACGPDGDCEPDGVPHSLLANGHYLYVVETNHNSVLRVDPKKGDDLSRV